MRRLWIIFNCRGDYQSPAIILYKKIYRINDNNGRLLAAPTEENIILPINYIILYVFFDYRIFLFISYNMFIKRFLPDRISNFLLTYILYCFIILEMVISFFEFMIRMQCI